MLQDPFVFGDQRRAGRFGIGDDQAVERVAGPRLLEGVGDDVTEGQVADAEADLGLEASDDRGRG